MKGYELLKAISDREIEDGTKIEIKGRFTGDLSGSYFIYNKGCFRFPIYEPDGTKYSDSVEIHDLINYSFEVIEENKEIEEKLDWEEIIGSIGKPLWDNKRKIWRVLDSYYREGNSFKISFSDTSNLEFFKNQELYFKEREEK